MTNCKWRWDGLIGRRSFIMTRSVFWENDDPTQTVSLFPPGCLMYRLPDLLPAHPSPVTPYSQFSGSHSPPREIIKQTARCEIQTLEPDNWSAVWRGRGPGATRGVKTDTRNPASFRGQLIIGLITNKQLQSAIIPVRSFFSPCHAIASFYRKTKSLSRNSSRGKTEEDLMQIQGWVLLLASIWSEDW